MFTVEQRDALRERVLRLADDDERAVAGAAVGSLALDGGDRFSDLDLTFGIANDVRIADVLDDWTRTLRDELDAVRLVDLGRDATNVPRVPATGRASGGASSTRSTRARASSAAVSGRRSTTSPPSATMRSRLPASVRGCQRCRRVATTMFPL